MREDVRAARRLGRVMIAAASLVFPIVLWVALPRYFEPTFGPRTALIESVPDELLLLIGATIVCLLGLAWIIRIQARSHLEPESSGWRYRGS
jgi:hypothetical protein